MPIFKVAHPLLHFCSGGFIFKLLKPPLNYEQSSKHWTTRKHLWRGAGVFPLSRWRETDRNRKQSFLGDRPMNIGDRVQTLNTFVPITGEIVDMYKNLVTIADDDAETTDDLLSFHADDLEVIQWDSKTHTGTRLLSVLAIRDGGQIKSG